MKVITPEILYTCTFCNQGNFTRRGLRQHWCNRGNPSRKSAQLTHDEWKSIVDSPPVPPKPPKIPSGPNMIDLNCGSCGHQGDWDEFVRENYPTNELHCPKCEHTWQIRSAGLAKVLDTPDGPLPIYNRQAVRIERTTVDVPAVRLQDDLWYPTNGDIRAAMVDHEKLKVRKVFEHDGHQWVTWGISQKDARCTPITLIAPGMQFGEKRRYSSENTVVTWKGQKYVCGPETEFRALPRGPGAEAEHARRLYALGGHFASSAGSYRSLLTKWLSEHNPTEIQRAVWQAEIDADLPQTQQGMRELLGLARLDEMPRFNPMTGKTN